MMVNSTQTWFGAFFSCSVVFFDCLRALPVPCLGTFSADSPRIRIADPGPAPPLLVPASQAQQLANEFGGTAITSLDGIKDLDVIIGVRVLWAAGNWDEKPMGSRLAWWPFRAVSGNGGPSHPAPLMRGCCIDTQSVNQHLLWVYHHWQSSIHPPFVSSRRTDVSHDGHCNRQQRMNGCGPAPQDVKTGRP